MSNHRIFSYMDEWGVQQNFDITPIIEASNFGIDNAWEIGCDLLAALTRALPHIERRHAMNKAAAYQRFKQIPKNTNPQNGPVNPGTDTHFANIWKASDETYNRTRIERDQIQAMIENLRRTYLPRLRFMAEAAKEGEQRAPSQYSSGMGRYDGSMASASDMPPPPASGIAPPGQFQ